MALSENDQDDFYSYSSPKLHSVGTKPTSKRIPRYGAHGSSYNSRHHSTSRQSRTAATATVDSKPATMSNPLPTSVSWPIILAVVPTLGSFITGSADVWSDFVMIVLILYYVYKWMTVPWSYYESARSRRSIAQTSMPSLSKDTSAQQLKELERRQKIAEELKRHELFGLFWVLASPIIGGYTLHYSRYFLSNYERYMSSFNVMVFVLAASLKPVAHVMTLLRERTLYLQSEIQVTESQVQLLQKKLDLLEDELDTLRKAFATKKDLGQVADGLSPTIQHLAKTLRRFEKKDTALRSWSEERFAAIEEKVVEFDQFIYYHMDQDKRQSAHGMVVTLVLLPLNIGLWVAKSMTGLLPVPRALLGSSPTVAAAKSSLHHRSVPSHMPSSKHLTHPDLQAENRARQRAATHNVSKHSEYISGDESISAFGHRSRNPTS